MSNTKELFSILRNIIFTINDFDKDRKDFFAKKGFVIKEQNQDDRLLKTYETLKSISAKLGVDEAGERNDYRANESCMIETPIGWYFLNLEYSRISIDYCPVTAPLLPVLINTEGLSVETIKENTLSHLKDLSQQHKDTYLYGHSKDIAFIQNDLSKVSVKDVTSFKQFIEYCSQIHIINYKEKQYLYKELNINQNWLQEHSSIERLNDSLDSLVSTYNRHRRVVDSNGYYHFNDKDDFLKCVTNEDFIYIESGDQSNNVVIIKDLNNNRLKVWKSAKIDDISLDDYISDSSSGKTLNVTDIMAMIINSHFSSTLPIEFEHSSFEKSFNFLMNNFEYEGEHLVYDSSKGINSKMLWFLENRISYFQYALN